MAVNQEDTGNLREIHFILVLVYILMSLVNMALEMENSMYGPEVLHECQCQFQCNVYICTASFSSVTHLVQLLGLYRNLS